MQDGTVEMMDFFAAKANKTKQAEKKSSVYLFISILSPQ